MKHNVGVIREHGFRYWVAWKLVQLAYKVWDTTWWQVVKIEGGSTVLVRADAWGSGVNGTRCVTWSDDEPRAGWPVLREFDDLDAALDWMHDEEGA